MTEAIAFHLEGLQAEGIEVPAPRFVGASGRTQALVELTLDDVRAVEDQDLISVRRN
jgi:predicted ArsR family transcriptional regulator